MTKEELEKEAWQYADKVCGWDKTQIFDYLVEAYLASAEPREKRIEELEAQIEKMKKELHHRLVSHSKSDSDCLDKIIGLDRLWQFGKEF